LLQGCESIAIHAILGILAVETQIGILGIGGVIGIIAVGSTHHVQTLKRHFTQKRFYLLEKRF
jgi:hypothetical protein